jgi:hypothetical protein
MGHVQNWSKIRSSQSLGRDPSLEDLVSTGVVTAECAITPLERAQSRDSLVREFERQWGQWVEIARVCVEIERDKDYVLLGYHSFGEWLMSAAPRSRSYLYLVIGRYKELAPEIPDAELEQIPLGSANILRQLSPGVRRESKIRLAARQKPSEFRKIVSEIAPNQHIEPIVDCRLRFQLSAWERIQAAYETYKLIDGEASLEKFFEWTVSECQ